MKLYLSSYKIGNEPNKLASMIRSGSKIAVIPNALDFSTDIERKQSTIINELESLRSLNLNPELLDLRDYFNQKVKLIIKIRDYNSVWTLGGNAFVLRKAMQLSGFDEVVKKNRINSDFVYAGYSAGPCVLSPSLLGLEIIDEPGQVKKTYNQETEWSGLNIIDFMFVPHYKSNHPESELVDKLVKHLDREDINYRTYKDGEVYISE
jgi:dipeptidase E